MKRLRIALLVAVACFALLAFVSVWAFFAPRTVNVVSGQNDYRSALAKAGFSPEDEPDWDAFLEAGAFSDSRDVDVTLTSAELTALLNGMAEHGAPFSEAGIRLCDGGSFEASFVLNNEAVELLRKQGVDFGPLSGMFTGRTLYTKGAVESGDGHIRILLTRVQIGQISLPRSELDKLEALLSFEPGMCVGAVKVSDITVGEDSFTYKGSLPSAAAEKG